MLNSLRCAIRMLIWKVSFGSFGLIAHGGCDLGFVDVDAPNRAVPIDAVPSRRKTICGSSRCAHGPGAAVIMQTGYE
jgi:hypothetical protein